MYRYKYIGDMYIYVIMYVHVLFANNNLNANINKNTSIKSVNIIVITEMFYIENNLFKEV